MLSSIRGLRGVSDGIALSVDKRITTSCCHKADYQLCCTTLVKELATLSLIHLCSKFLRLVGTRCWRMCITSDRGISLSVIMRDRWFGVLSVDLRHDQHLYFPSKKQFEKVPPQSLCQEICLANLWDCFIWANLGQARLFHWSIAGVEQCRSAGR